MTAERTPWNPSRRATARVRDPIPAPETCPHCQSGVKIANNSEIYAGKSYGEWPWAYVCGGCGAYVGMHPFTSIPLGTLATPAIREARKRAKSLFNPLWNSGRMSRDEAYAWLAAQLALPLAECHFGMFDESRCRAAIVAIAQRSFSLEHMRI